MRIYGLIGKSLTHSFSPKYFKEKFEKEGIKDTFYQLYPLETIDEFNYLISDYTEISGLNVTIPYKQSILHFLDYIEPAAKQIGAVNTIKFEWENNRLKLSGYNTDYLGFLESIKPMLEGKNKKALILGTGGSSAAVKYALKLLQIEYKLVSRNPEGKNVISYDSLDEKLIKEHQIIINTTPLGMFPDILEYPDIPYNYLTKEHLLYDLIYNPEETQFLKLGREQGAKVQNGLKMLELQANYSWKIWND